MCRRDKRPFLKDNGDIEWKMEPGADKACRQEGESGLDWVVMVEVRRREEHGEEFVRQSLWDM